MIMANVTRWNPVRDLLTMREAMDNAFNDRFMRVFEGGRAAVLPIDAYATEEAIVIMTDVPGLKPDELKVTFEGDTLTIRGEIKPVEQKNFLLRERMVGKFERTLTVNTPVDADKIEAEFENGVLTLTLPKAEAVKPKQINIRPKTTVNNN
jgi:HSP20 family protein